MMSLKIFTALLLLVPAISANIEINVVAAAQQNESSVSVSGRNVAVISDTERNTFKIQDSGLKNAVEKYHGKRPDDAYVRSPTPWGDLYQTYNWPQVTTTLRPVRGRIVSFQSQPSIIKTQYFENNSSIPGEFNVQISESVANTISTTWTKGGEVSVGQEINYGFDIKVVSVGGSTTFEYTSSWGQSVEKSETITVGSESGVTVTLQPGQKIVAELSATRGAMQIQVDYEASLSGRTAVNYKKPYQGHHFWGLEINAVMTSGGLSRTSSSTEVLKMGYYSESRVVIRDARTLKVLYVFPVPIISQ
jgi:hypothetical protein